MNKYSWIGPICIYCLIVYYFSFQTCTIDNIPDKCLLGVFSYIRQQELGKLARVCKKWRMLAYDSRLWQVVSLRPEYNGLHIYNYEALLALINVRFGPTLRYIELPCEMVTPPVLHELANKCPSLRYMTLDFSNAMQLHDFNDLNSFPCNLRSLCICLSEVIFLEGFMRRIYSCLSSLSVLHLIGKHAKIHLYENHTYFNSLSTECHLLITFANSLDPDQAGRNVGPDLDPNCLTLWWYS